MFESFNKNMTSEAKGASMYTAVVINLFALICLLVALKKDRAKTRQALVMAFKSFFRILPKVLVIIMFIGLLLGFVTKAEVARVVGEQAGFRGALLTALIGAILYMPSILSFPLAASLLKSGASVTAVAVFITTLTMVGVVTLPLEIEELGKKIALLRNGMSFVVAFAIGILMGVIL